MDRDQLRTAQAPLKEQYRNDPDAAVITLRAEGALSSSDISCSVQTGRALVEAGLHPATGGDGSFACSGDMLLQALVACAGVTLRSVATNRGLDVDGLVLGRAARLIVRTAQENKTRVRVRIDGRDATTIELVPTGGWKDNAVTLPADHVRGSMRISLTNEGPGDFVDYHVWLTQ